MRAHCTREEVDERGIEQCTVLRGSRSVSSDVGTDVDDGAENL